MQALTEALARALGVPVASLRRVAGGDLNEAFAAELGDGRRVFVKTAANAAPAAYAAEAAGLGWLASAGAVALPCVVGAADDDGAPRFLALEWIEAGSPRAGTFEQFGRELAALHAAGAPSFGGGGGGGERALVLGPLTLPNDPSADWPAFYATRRLEPLAALAADRGALPPGASQSLARLIDRLDELAGPSEPPARLHGDLWSGNVMIGADGRPWLIDPAAYGGHREVDLAMLRLFGSPSERLFDAYEEVAPLAPGHEDRVALWQIMPLLAHAALFGGGWGDRAVSLIRRYVA